MEEKELINKIIEKDEDAFAAYMVNKMGLFYDIAKRILTNTDAVHEDIMDCISESLIYIWFHIDQYDIEKYSFRNWCSLIVAHRSQNVVTQLNRRKKKMELVNQSSQLDEQHFNSAEKIYFSNMSYEELLEKIDLLSSPSREIFIYRYIYGLKPKDIAKKMNISTVQIDNSLRRAKKILRKELSGK